MAFMPAFAPLVVLMFLGTCFAVVVIALGMVYGLVRGKHAIVKDGLVSSRPRHNRRRSQALRRAVARRFALEPKGPFRNAAPKTCR
jgi:hypothetical protein